MMFGRLTPPGRRPPAKPTATPNSTPQVFTAVVSTKELCDTMKLTISAALGLLKDTNWPPESNETAQNLLQTIDDLPDLPEDITPVKDTVEEFVRVLEAVHTSLKKASEKYGKKERGFRAVIKYRISALRPSQCTDILRTSREDIEKVSTTLRTRLENVTTINSTPPGSVKGPAIPSGHQNQSILPPFVAGSSLRPSESQALQTESIGQAMTLEPPTSQRASIQDSSPDLPEDQETLSPVRDGVLKVAKKTFQIVEAGSGLIPGVGDYVGAAAKVGLAFVNMIETMDRNEDVSKELAAHTSKLSGYLEHFKKKFDAEDGDEIAAHIHGLHRELGCIQEKVNRGNSSGRFKKAFRSSNHAEELKGYLDTVQTTVEEIQLLVSMKTADLVVELKNSELRTERRRLLNCLGDGRYGARGNSIGGVVCLPGTRVEILDRINTWIKDTSGSAERVLWIRGMAGRGKSTIASTVAHSWASKGSCAIFHFRRGQNAADDQFVCALARQLGKGLVPEVKNAILDCVRENEDIAKERLEQQFKTLFVGSLGKLQDHAHPIIIIVDALDECENVADAVCFVRLIDQHSSFLPPTVKFLLTCRPEAPLLVALEPRKWHAEDLDSTSHARDDITRFIQHSCAQIRENHGLPEDWPSSTDLKGIVEMSQGLFQWARTAITYIGDRSPSNRLQELLQHSSKWGKLDYLYRQILSKAFDEAAENSMRKQLLSWVLETLVVAPYPVSLEVVAFLHADHEIFRGQGDTVQFLRNDILADLSSLLHIPSSPCEPLRLMHTSIRDLLVSRERCDNQHYFVELVQAHRRLASVSLGIMERDLRKNICKLSDISKANSEIQDAVESYVPKGLRYCCYSWCIHLTTGISWPETEGAAASDALSKFRRVSEERLLAWLEVMSLIGATNEALTVAKQLYQWLQQWPRDISSGDLVTLWNDTQRFIASFSEPISFGALHIYASALLHCPTGTKLWAKYGDQATIRILQGEQHLHWPANIWASSLGSLPSRLVFSPDGRALACILKNNTVQLLDAQTGVRVGDPLNDHWSGTPCVAFLLESEVMASWSYGKAPELLNARTGARLGGPSNVRGGRFMQWTTPSPDGKVLASELDDGTVQLWDVQNGTQLGDPLTGCEGENQRLFFSPDGKLLASLSDDTVCLWDGRTGAQLVKLPAGSEGKIHHVVFSPDDTVLVCGSDHSTVRIWDGRTGAQLGEPLTVHDSRLKVAFFSKDGNVLASVWDDNTIRLWDARTGTQLGNPLLGHEGSIRNIVFSPPDGKVLASVSDDTVCLWDARTGAQLGNPLTVRNRLRTIPFQFSPDGKILASVSDGHEARLWDVQTGSQLGDPLSVHNSLVIEPAAFGFSPDGKVLVSVSLSDTLTLRLWDARNGARLGDPLNGHSSHIASFAFSPDGKVLASGSGDGTVRLWDTQAVAQLGDGPTAHKDKTMTVVCSPDGTVLASVSYDNAIRLWDVSTGVQLGDPLTGHEDWIEDLIFSPDSRVLVSQSHDRRVRLWDVRTRAQLGDTLTEHGHSTRWTSSILLFSPDGTILASRSDRHTVRLLNARTGAALRNSLIVHDSGMASVIFSPDSNLLASTTDNGTIQIWDARTGAHLSDALIAHKEGIPGLAFSPDSRVLAFRYSGDFPTHGLLDARTGARLGEHLAGDKGDNVPTAPSPDGMLACGPKDAIRGTVPLWDFFAWQMSAGSLNEVTPIKLSTESNWIIYNSKRLVWLPVHYQSSPTILLSHGRLIVHSDGIFSITDVAGLLKP